MKILGCVLLFVTIPLVTLDKAGERSSPGYGFAIPNASRQKTPPSHSYFQSLPPPPPIDLPSKPSSKLPTAGYPPSKPLTSGYPPAKPPATGYPPAKPPTPGYSPAKPPIPWYPPSKPEYPPSKPPTPEYPPSKPHTSGYPPSKPPTPGYPPAKPLTPEYLPSKPLTFGYPPAKPPTTGYPPSKPPTTGYSPSKPPTLGYPASKPPTFGYPPGKPPTPEYPPSKPPKSGYPPAKPPTSRYSPAKPPTEYPSSNAPPAGYSPPTSGYNPTKPTSRYTYPPTDDDSPIDLRIITPSQQPEAGAGYSSPTSGYNPTKPTSKYTHPPIDDDSSIDLRILTPGQQSQISRSPNPSYADSSRAIDRLTPMQYAGMLKFLSLMFQPKYPPIDPSIDLRIVEEAFQPNPASSDQERIPDVNASFKSGSLKSRPDISQPVENVLISVPSIGQVISGPHLAPSNQGDQSLTDLEDHRNMEPILDQINSMPIENGDFQTLNLNQGPGQDQLNLNFNQLDDSDLPQEGLSHQGLNQEDSDIAAEEQD